MPSLRPRSSNPSVSMVRLTTLCLGLALCLFLSAMLSAQGTGGRILGRISDPTGAVLSAVKVTATNDATGVTQDVAATTAATLRSPTFRLARTPLAST